MNLVGKKNLKSPVLLPLLKSMELYNELSCAVMIIRVMLRSLFYHFSLACNLSTIPPFFVSGSFMRSRRVGNVYLFKSWNRCSLNSVSHSQRINMHGKVFRLLLSSMTTRKARKQPKNLNSAARSKKWLCLHRSLFTCV